MNVKVYDCYFADLAGFTAWSSQRDPPQVFTLLETLYRSFDELAAKLKVFKVETIGDCYGTFPNRNKKNGDHTAIVSFYIIIIVIR